MEPSEWRAFLFDVDPTLRLRDGASEAELEDAERQLGHRLSPELRSLLATANGIDDEPEWNNYCWPLRSIVKWNLYYRHADSPFFGDGRWSERLCFASNGAHAEFYLPSSGDAPVCAWYPILDERRVIASDIRDYLRGWIGGIITT